MHVFIITQYFPPEIGASASRWGDYAKILIKQNESIKENKLGFFNSLNP